MHIDNKFVTSLFCKPNFSSVLINFKNVLPTQCKFGLPNILLHQCFAICSLYEHFHEEIIIIKDIFKMNEYLHKRLF